MGGALSTIRNLDFDTSDFDIQVDLNHKVSSTTRPSRLASPTAERTSRQGILQRLDKLRRAELSLVKRKVLSEPTLAAVADLIKSGKVHNIITLTGAGISTATGIPDFRSPETGLYDNLQKYNLPYPEAIFDIEYFMQNPKPFYVLARDLYPDQYLPTKAHYFITLLHRHQLLLKAFTQNIDTLEFLAGVPDDKLVEAHGSFAHASCVVCGHRYPGISGKYPGVETANSNDDWSLRDYILGGEVPRCKNCSLGIVKPDITFFGEALPHKFYRSLGAFSSADLLIIMGTSLQIQPFASLRDRVPEHVPRLLINRDIVGLANDEGEGFDFKGAYNAYSRDAYFQGDCDQAVEQICDLLGWRDELEQMYSEGNRKRQEEWRELKEKRPEVSIDADRRSSIIELIRQAGEQITPGEGTPKHEFLTSGSADALPSLEASKPQHIRRASYHIIIGESDNSPAEHPSESCSS